MTINDGSAVFAVRKRAKVFKGIITAYSGTISNGHPTDENGLEITDWHVCDGTNGTPDLSGRFILGASTSHAAGTTGGEETHTLTVAEMPSHTHGIYHDDNFSAHYNATTITNVWKQALVNSTNPNISPPVNTHTQATGGGNAHNNMPPYYALVFIMKL